MAVTSAQTGSAADREDQGATATLVKASRAPVDQVLGSLETAVAGLPADEVERRLERSGPNVVSTAKPPRLLKILWQSFRNPFVLLLVVLALIMVVTDDMIGAGTIAVMVVISVGLNTSQELKAGRAAFALAAMVVSTTTVRRDGQLQEIPVSAVVTGDIVELKAGDLIPADLRVIAARDLNLSQSALTGESHPQDKTTHELDTDASGVLHARNLCFMGTSVLSGTGFGVVVATGRDTYFGAMAKAVESVTTTSAYDAAIRKVSWLLIRLMLVIGPLVFALNWWHTGDWLEALLFAVAIAVGLTPSMLPTIVSANLARGTSFMAARKVIVKVPDAIQSLGSMDVLCTDKTGTLTEDRIVLQRHLDIAGQPSQLTLVAGYLNSMHTTGVRNTLDAAVISAYQKSARTLTGEFRVVDEIPFDFERRRLSVVLDTVPSLGGAAPGEGGAWELPQGLALGQNEDLLVTKGACEEILAICDRVLVDGQIVALTEQRAAQARATAAAENAAGMRLLATAAKIIPAEVASRRLDPDGDWSYSPADEVAMVLVGFLTFLDPPKESAAAAIESLHASGVDVKVISGDSTLVCGHVVEALGMWGDIPAQEWPLRTMTGVDVDALDDAALTAKAADVMVFAEMSPLQKSRVVQALRDRGHVVGYLGDGINDAPALRQADVGISVPDGVDIAKDTADIILLEQDLEVLRDGLLEGRRTFGNIQKYLKITVASNFGNVLSVLIASVFIPFLPMLAIQLLAQNMIYDLAQTSLPWDRMDKEFLAKPRTWTDAGLVRFMLWLGPVSTVFDVVAFAVMWFVFGATGVTQAGAEDVASQNLFQTGWFLIGLTTQVMVVHMIRTAKVPFLQSTASRPVLVASVIAVAAAVALPLIPVTREAFDFAVVPGTYYVWLVVIVVAYCVTTQAIKNLYIRRYRQWL